MCRAASGVARRGAIYDARCPWGHKVSAAWRTAIPAFFSVIPGDSVSHPGVTSGAPTFFVQAVVGCGGVPCECVGLPAALPVGAPFMTPGARGGTRCRPHGARRYPRFFRSSRVIASVIRASQVAPLRFLCRRLWVAAAGHLADLCRLQSRQSIWQFSLTVRPPRLHGTMWSASMNVSSISLPQRAHRPPCSS